MHLTEIRSMKIKKIISQNHLCDRNFERKTENTWCDMRQRQKGKMTLFAKAGQTCRRRAVLADYDRRRRRRLCCGHCCSPLSEIIVEKANDQTELPSVAIFYLSPWKSSCLFLPSKDTHEVFLLSGETEICGGKQDDRVNCRRLCGTAATRLTRSNALISLEFSKQISLLKSAMLIIEFFSKFCCFRINKEYYL